MKRVLIILLLFLTACQQAEKETVASFFVMDTFVSVKIYGEENAKVVDEVQDLFEYYHRLTDRYNEYEGIINVYSINNMESEYLIIDDDLKYLIDYALLYYQKTDGLFDISMGPLIDVWKNHISDKKTLPLLTDLEAITWQQVLISDNKIYAGAKLDLGALAKGFALKKAGLLLEEAGYDKYLINAGGQVLVGNSYRNDPYKIGIKHPYESGSFLIVEVENVNVSTSGSYERFFEIDGKYYNHIINPNTLFPADYFWSVTVIGEDSLLVDLLTTALFLMPLDEGLKFIEAYNVEAVWYTIDGEIVKSKGFNLYE